MLSTPLSNPDSTVHDSASRRNGTYRLTNGARWGTMTFLLYPQGSPEWYQARAFRIAALDARINTRRSRERAHYALLAIAAHVRTEDPGMSATILAWATQIRRRWWTHGAPLREVA